MGGYLLQGRSAQQPMVIREHVDCTPCMKAISSRGRVDCVVRRGKACTACQRVKKVCIKEGIFLASNFELRRRYDAYKAIANRENPVSFNKHGKGVQAKEYSEAFNEARLAFEEAWDEAKASGYTATPVSSLRHRDPTQDNNHGIIDFPPTPTRGRQEARPDPNMAQGVRMIGESLNRLARDAELTHENQRQTNSLLTSLVAAQNPARLGGNGRRRIRGRDSRSPTVDEEY